MITDNFVCSINLITKIVYVGMTYIKFLIRFSFDTIYVVVKKVMVAASLKEFYLINHQLLRSLHLT